MPTPSLCRRPNLADVRHVPTSSLCRRPNLADVRHVPTSGLADVQPCRRPACADVRPCRRPAKTSRSGNIKVVYIIVSVFTEVQLARGRAAAGHRKWRGTTSCSQQNRRPTASASSTACLRWQSLSNCTKSSCLGGHEVHLHDRRDWSRRTGAHKAPAGV